jgi:hypothetical protein
MGNNNNNKKERVPMYYFDLDCKLGFDGTEYIWVTELEGEVMREGIRFMADLGLWRTGVSTGMSLDIFIKVV